MGLDRELEAMRRRLNKIAPIVSPPELKMNIYSEEEWDNKKPTSKSQWEIDLVIEKKPDNWGVKQDEQSLSVYHHPKPRGISKVYRESGGPINFE